MQQFAYDRYAMSQQHALITLFADISGSTKLFEICGNDKARRLVANVLMALTHVALNHGGRVIKTIGDEIMCTFPTVLQGLFAATDMQRKIRGDAGFAREALAIRIGLHYGDVLEEQGDVFGDAVNIAARMVALAKRDQIVATASTIACLTRSAGLRVRSLGTARISGKLSPIGIVDVIWQEDISNITTVQRLVQVGKENPLRMHLTLRFRDQTFVLDELSSNFTVGREKSNNLVIDAEWVSRTHAMLEWKRGYFVLSDRSTNGTWLKWDSDKEELFIHHDEIQLRNSGIISPGQVCNFDSTDLLFFKCES